MKTVVKTDKAPGAIGPYSQGIDLGNMIFFSGQIPLNPQTGEMPEGIEKDKPETARRLPQKLGNFQAERQARGTDALYRA